MKKKELDIIIPIYYEEGSIKSVISTIIKKVRTPHNILLIYDLETDPTIPVVRSLQKEYDHIHLIKNMYGKGVVGALKTGLKRIISPLSVITMADLSDNPSDIDKMVKKMHEGYDVVAASRYMKGGGKQGAPFLKQSLSQLGGLSLHLLTGIPTVDATNAFKCFRKEVVDAITIESRGGFELPLEMTVKAYAMGYRITEIPTFWKERESGKSKFKLAEWLPHYLRWYFFALTHKNKRTN